jgi:hypothetical protein
MKCALCSGQKKRGNGSIQRKTLNEYEHISKTFSANAERSRRNALHVTKPLIPSMVIVPETMVMKSARDVGYQENTADDPQPKGDDADSLRRTSPDATSP